MRFSTKGLILVKSLVLLADKGSSYKSWLMLDLARAVAKGRCLPVNEYLWVVNRTRT